MPGLSDRRAVVGSGGDGHGVLVVGGRGRNAARGGAGVGSGGAAGGGLGGELQRLCVGGGGSGRLLLAIFPGHGCGCLL